MAIDTKQTKSIGEHWVASELARRDWAPALTRDGLERTDILAVRTVGERVQIEVQVKSARAAGKRISWPLGLKSQQPPLHAYEWFVMVAADPDVSQPLRGFVIPRAHVAAAAWIAHMEWLTDPDAEPGKRNAGVDRSRVWIPDFEAYEGRWDLLGYPTTEVPVLLPSRFHDLALLERVGLPPEHPWHENLPEW